MSHRHIFIESDEQALEIIARNPPRGRTDESYKLVLLAQRRLMPVTTEEERRKAREFNAARGYVCQPYIAREEA